MREDEKNPNSQPAGRTIKRTLSMFTKRISSIRTPRRLLDALPVTVTLKRTGRIVRVGLLRGTDVESISFSRAARKRRQPLDNTVGG